MLVKLMLVQLLSVQLMFMQLMFVQLRAHRRLRFSLLRERKAVSHGRHRGQKDRNTLASEPGDRADLAGEVGDRVAPVSIPSSRFICKPSECRSALAKVGPTP